MHQEEYVLVRRQSPHKFIRGANRIDSISDEGGLVRDVQCKCGGVGGKLPVLVALEGAPLVARRPPPVLPTCTPGEAHSDVGDPLQNMNANT